MNSNGTATSDVEALKALASDRFPVEQYGQRRLWDEVSAAYLRWVEVGQPSRSRYGITVTPDGHDIWLDDPQHPVA